MNISIWKFFVNLICLSIFFITIILSLPIKLRNKFINKNKKIYKMLKKNSTKNKILKTSLITKQLIMNFNQLRNKTMNKICKIFLIIIINN